MGNTHSNSYGAPSRRNSHRHFPSMGDGAPPNAPPPPFGHEGQYLYPYPYAPHPPPQVYQNPGAAAYPGQYLPPANPYPPPGAYPRGFPEYPPPPAYAPAGAEWVTGGVPPPPMFRVPSEQRPPALPAPPTPSFAEPQRTATIRNDVNLKRGTLRLEPDPENPGHSLVAFTFDALAAGSLCIFFLVREGSACSFTPARPDLHTPARVPFEKGLGQKFVQEAGTGVDLSRFDPQELARKDAGDVWPLVVRTETAPPPPGGGGGGGAAQPGLPGAPLPTYVQSQTTYATIQWQAAPAASGRPLGGEEGPGGKGGRWVAKVAKQKIWVDGVKYELQEIYGIEQGGGGGGEGGASGASEQGKECVICMTEARDTTLLPCRHMCMCSSCASVLRYQTNRCPICRQVVDALLEIRLPPEGGERAAAIAAPPPKPAAPGGDGNGAEGSGPGGGPPAPQAAGIVQVGGAVSHP